MLNEVVGRLDADWEVRIDSGDTPIRPDLAIEISLEEQENYEGDEPCFTLTET
ncbi:MAG: hypothetical protein UY48_C0033G0004 [Candidatus Gottesmanbacteria bacterium GW2011_GWB1_49_7]|uniref:Uncharacterized protein n=1 Tax=Candidatus Gottesmanbacteria bacterium GW2011_GWB1_49_7 TaxID=1618448 RepID=A0A0G1VW00_9BACT|nr:MAG: hypothetical protein UY48_C0033G0004 [Candidatus Gottesmanbacteria bacterium GW2011_GWB1_49_7]